MKTTTLLIYLFIMASVTYLIRMAPLMLIRKKIENKFVRSFLYYIPYAVLAAMTVPAIFTATASVYSALAGFAVGVTFAFFDKPLIIVASFSCCAVYITEIILKLL